MPCRMVRAHVPADEMFPLVSCSAEQFRESDNPLARLALTE